MPRTSFTEMTGVFVASCGTSLRTVRHYGASASAAAGYPARPHRGEEIFDNFKFSGTRFWAFMNSEHKFDMEIF